MKSALQLRKMESSANPSLNNCDAPSTTTMTPLALAADSLVFEAYDERLKVTLEWPVDADICNMGKTGLMDW